MTDLPLGPGEEFDVIRALQKRWGSLATGIGDDAALLKVPRGDLLVASVDAAVEGRHFKAEWLTPREIGYRAVTAALSDLAAMAARPLGILIALGVPREWRARILDLADGIGDAALQAPIRIHGGNLSDAGELSLTTTVLGHALAPLTRSGARRGDRMYVTGRLGAPAAAIHALASGEPRDALPLEVRDRFVRPLARIAEARWLADYGATAAVDISDGLVADLRHIAAASGVSIELDVDRVPCFDGVSAETALESGEEYELVVSSPSPIDANAFRARFGLPLTDIGRVVDARGGAPEVRLDGARVASVSGHDHFSP